MTTANTTAPCSRRRWRSARRTALSALLLLAWAGSSLAASYIVVDAETGEVLGSKDPSAVWYPASLTKVMTVFLTFERIRAGRLGLADALTVSARAAGQPPTKIGLRAGEKITVEQAIAATIVRSANDAAVVLAEAVAGDEAAFARRMTARAAELGMTDTRFRNASGLPHAGQVTTARDMAILARSIRREFPELYRFFSLRSFVWRGETLPTYNGLLLGYPGADGLKTGFTCDSGYNLMLAAERGGRRLVGVLLGAETRAARSGRMRSILDAAFSARSGDAVRTRLAELTRAGPAPPPRVLSPASCDRDVVKMAAEAEATSRPASTAKSTPPTGWGVMLGRFVTVQQARERIENTRRSFGGLLKEARSWLVASGSGPARHHAAMLVGLDQRQAVATCQVLRARGQSCAAYGPELLSGSRRPW